MPHTDVNQACILRLPDELLGNIIEIATAFHRPNIRIHHVLAFHRSLGSTLQCQTILALVCRRFNQIVTPMMYCHISIFIRSHHLPRKRQEEAACKLHRTLRANPSLWPLCRTLLVNFEGFFRSVKSGYVERDYHIATDLVIWLTSTEEVHFEISDNSNIGDAWTLAQLVLKHMPRLKGLALSDPSNHSIQLSHVYRALQGPSCLALKTLNLGGISTQDGSEALRPVGVRSLSK